MKPELKLIPIIAGRDILAEAVAEGHRLGLHVEAWFEYGFVGGWTGNQPPGVKGPIFQAHPDWVAKKARRYGNRRQQFLLDDSCS